MESTEIDILNKIKINMENSCKNGLVTIGMVADLTETLYILWVDNLMAGSILISKNKDTKYIKLSDSTGFNRGYTLNFIKAVIQVTPGFIVCFSYPKDELIFGKSIKNSLKKKLSPRDLFNFWKECLKSRCNNVKCMTFSNNKNKNCYFSTWSNFESTKSYPYKKISEIRKFKDDPMSKMKDKFENVSDLFNGLLVRNDFINGGLLFSMCNCSNIKVLINKKYKVNEILKFLRESDFSNDENARISCKNFDEKFQISKISFTVNKNNDINGSEKDPEIVRTIKPRNIL